MITGVYNKISDCGRKDTSSDKRSEMSLVVSQIVYLQPIRYFQ
ncbi:hypothetical protein M7I_5289 [Glarea lozoyensis 74030]|uniref:Uncharacterized protein n=1 Tax=Glarea lozoyensis (strain ATCC 74030 / MF5533) TaxID=1104152 RepID=H0ERH0_GLAL7|nr:hypothetical protein M7I_5289 [Glarea lozoyensis 74030]